MKQNRLPRDWQGLYPDFRRVGVYFVDPERQLSVVALTNTALEGGFGAFVPAIRNAVYG
jgi:hypothetical protein